MSSEKKSLEFVYIAQDFIKLKISDGLSWINSGSFEYTKLCYQEIQAPLVQQEMSLSLYKPWENHYQSVIVINSGVNWRH